MIKSRSNRILLFFIIFLISVSSLTIFKVNSQSFETIIIDTDGSIDPINSSIKRIGNTYTFTKNIKGTIEVLSHDITIDGDGYDLQGDGLSTGIDVQAKDDVTIKNLTISNHSTGIKLSAFRVFPTFEPPNVVGYRASISNNTILNNDVGVLGDADHDTVFSGNYILDNRIGIDSRDSVRPVFSENQFLSNGESLLVNLSAYYDDSNTIDGIPVSTPTPAPTPTHTPTPIVTPEPISFPTAIVIVSTVTVVIGLGIFFYFKKRHKLR